jgi:exonuclease III
MKIVSWNCKGMVSRFKEEDMRDLIKSKKSVILLLEETKLKAA